MQSSNIGNSSPTSPTFNSPSSINSITDTNTKIITLVPNGVKHFLKGQIIYITFLDNFGNLLTPKLQHTNPNTIAALPINNNNNNNNNQTSTSPNNSNNTCSSYSSSSMITADNSNSNVHSSCNSYASDDIKIPTKSHKSK